MKKILSFVLVLVVSLSFSACTPDKEVDYHEKQEVQGSYTVEQLLNLSAEEFIALSDKFIEVKFNAMDLSYNENLLREVTYRNFTETPTAFLPNSGTQSLYIYCSTTTLFYEDSTKINDMVTIQGWVALYTMFLDYENTYFSPVGNKTLPGNTHKHLVLSPAFIIT